MAQKRIAPQHPGVYLRDALEAWGITLNQLARGTCLPLSRVSEIANGQRSMTADTAMRFGRYFGVAPVFWMGVQADYDLQLGMENIEQIEREVVPAASFLRPRSGI